MGDGQENALDEIERRVGEKWIAAASARIPDNFDVSQWADMVDTDDGQRARPPRVAQFPREQWASYPAKRRLVLNAVERMLDTELTDENWARVCLLMQYGGKTRIS
jgi:hypothetical protein